MKSVVKNLRQSPHKVRLVADLVRGKKVDRALTALAFLTKKASDPVRVAIESAVANAKNNQGVNEDKLYIQEIKVDEGVTLMRRMPRARGSAYPIKKRSSHITVVLAEKTPEAASKKQADLDNERKVEEPDEHEHDNHEGHTH